MSFTLPEAHIEFLDVMAKRLGVTRTEFLRRIIGRCIGENNFAVVFADNAEKPTKIAWCPHPPPPKKLLEKLGLADLKIVGIIDLSQYGMTTADLRRLLMSGFLEPTYLLRLIDREVEEGENNG